MRETEKTELEILALELSTAAFAYLEACDDDIGRIKLVFNRDELQITQQKGSRL